LAAERELLQGARAALASRDAASALAVIDRHHKVYPKGHLVEEREALAVQALALSGDRDAAVERAERFRARFPRSILLRVVDAAVRKP
jgi:outer membrane protein assembly factor BamD (BamD/ComL family)